MTKSTPSMSPSGNAMPQSMISISPSHSIRVMFLPISFSPPRNDTLTDGFTVFFGFCAFFWLRLFFCPFCGVFFEYRLCLSL